MKDKILKMLKSYHFILIILIIITLFVLMYCNKIMKQCNAYIFEGKSDYVEINSGVIALNYNMNLFQGSNINYIAKEDKSIVSYDIGYYVLINDEYQPLASMASDDEGNIISLKKIIEGKDNFRVFEFSKSNYYFTKDKINNLNNLYFIIKATDEEGNIINDVIKLELIKLTK